MRYTEYQFQIEGEKNLHCIIKEWSAVEMEAFVWERRTKPWATEQMRLRLLCFPKSGDFSARAAAHARAAAVKVRGIGFLSDATVSVCRSQPFQAKVGRRCHFLMCPCCAKTTRIYSRLLPRSTCKHLAGRLSRHFNRQDGGNDNTEELGPPLQIVPTGLRKRSIRSA